MTRLKSGTYLSLEKFFPLTGFATTGNRNNIRDQPSSKIFSCDIFAECSLVLRLRREQHFLLMNLLTFFLLF